MKLTVVKKVEGNLGEFKKALCKELGLWEDQVTVKFPTNHVQIEVSSASPLGME